MVTFSASDYAEFASAFLVNSVYLACDKFSKSSKIIDSQERALAQYQSLEPFFEAANYIKDIHDVVHGLYERADGYFPPPRDNDHAKILYSNYERDVIRAIDNAISPISTKENAKKFHTIEHELDEIFDTIRLTVTSKKRIATISNCHITLMRTYTDKINRFSLQREIIMSTTSLDQVNVLMQEMKARKVSDNNKRDLLDIMNNSDKMLLSLLGLIDELYKRV